MKYIHLIFAFILVNLFSNSYTMERETKPANTGKKKLSMKFLVHNTTPFSVGITFKGKPINDQWVDNKPFPNQPKLLAAKVVAPQHQALLDVEDVYQNELLAGNKFRVSIFSLSSSAIPFEPLGRKYAGERIKVVSLKNAVAGILAFRVFTKLNGDLDIARLPFSQQKFDGSDYCIDPKHKIQSGMSEEYQ